MIFTRRVAAGPLIVLIALIGAGVTAPGAADEALYRWVDEHGQVHYSDRIPPGHSQQGHDKLNESGRVIDTVEPPKTPEELETEQRQAVLEAEQREIEEAQAQRDRALLQTFTTESDLILVRDSRLDIVNSRLKNAEREHADLQSRLAALGTGESAPAEELRERLARLEDYIDDKRQQRQDIEARFAADLERFRELKSEMP